MPRIRSAPQGQRPDPGQSELPALRLLVTVAIFAIVCVAAIALADDAGSRWFWFIPQGLACLWVGWALREAAWIAGALALLPVFLALPFGLPDKTFAEGPPVVLFEVLLVPVYVGLIVVGAVVRRQASS
jgi:hypothetical protein